MLNRNPLSRLRLAGRLCTAGAWTILVLGFILVVLFYVLSNIGSGLGSGTGLEIFLFSELIIVMLSFFFFLVLYGIGALLNYLGASKRVLEEETTPVRMRNQSELEVEGAQLEITPIQKMQ